MSSNGGLNGNWPFSRHISFASRSTKRTKLGSIDRGENERIDFANSFLNSRLVHPIRMPRSLSQDSFIKIHGKKIKEREEKRIIRFSQSFPDRWRNIKRGKLKRESVRFVIIFFFLERMKIKSSVTRLITRSSSRVHFRDAF